jgi:hypothetical protein
VIFGRLTRYVFHVIGLWWRSLHRHGSGEFGISFLFYPPSGMLTSTFRGTFSDSLPSHLQRASIYDHFRPAVFSLCKCRPHVSYRLDWWTLKRPWEISFRWYCWESWKCNMSEEWNTTSRGTKWEISGSSFDCKSPWALSRPTGNLHGWSAGELLTPVYLMTCPTKGSNPP